DTGSTKASITFTDDRHIVLGGDTTIFKDFEFAKMFSEFGLRPGADMITFMCLSPTSMEIKGDYTALLEQLSTGGEGRPSPEAIKKFKPTETVQYTVSDTALTLKSANGKAIEFRKIPDSEAGL